jgi:Arc/MetJ-type ribon-helix-helix transcriptional regulator
MVKLKDKIVNVRIPASLWADVEIWKDATGKKTASAAVRAALYETTKKYKESQENSAPGGKSGD